MSDCIFCGIVNNKIPAQVIDQDHKTLAFLDILPLAKGHTVVIPKIHAATIEDLTEFDAQALMPAVSRVVKLLDTSFSPDGFTIGINHKIGQAVPHLHIHVIPRWVDDGGGSIHSIVKNPPTETVQDIAEKIKTAK
jgi:histidine triad (HIT) family protein